MNEHVLVAIPAILALGVGSQWVAWRLGVPSILVLLLSGFTAGPLLGVLDPDAIVGDLLFTFVSLAVAVILFEGGLRLSLSELEGVRDVVQRLITVGALVTWTLSTAFSYLLLDLGFALSVLLGAILVVSGPTVVMPLLEHFRLSARVNSVLKWEGIFIDPVGAILAVLVFQTIVATQADVTPVPIVIGFLLTTLTGVVVGSIGAAIIYFALDGYRVPEALRNSVTLAIVLIVFAISDLIRVESGLLAVTLMGVVLANQRRISVGRIIEFKEELRGILLAVLFVVLSARLTMEELTGVLNMRMLLFLIALVLLVRPATVVVSSLRSRLEWREVAFISWLAPRGIVAASVSSVFGIELAELGYEGAEQLTPLTFVVIVSTVAIYGLTMGSFASFLGLTQPRRSQESD